MPKECYQQVFMLLLLTSIVCVHVTLYEKIDHITFFFQKKEEKLFISAHLVALEL